MPLLRRVSLSESVSGYLYLSGMPGRYGAFESERDRISAAGVDTVLCLTPLDEIECFSPEYARAIHAGTLPWRQWPFPIRDFGVPDDRAAFLARVQAAAEHLRGGGKLLIHCHAGIGRTGTAAACVLITLGMSREDALDAVNAAGSHTEDPDQLDLIGWVVRQVDSRLQHQKIQGDV
jgi:protein-tyrosine phosphatase